MRTAHTGRPRDTAGADKPDRREPSARRGPRLACIGLALAALMLAPSAGAATLPGLPSWTATTAWWTQLHGVLDQAGWHLPPAGSPTPPSPPPSGGGSAGAGNGASFSGSYTAAAGSRVYSGYVPSTYKQGTAVPLVVVLHGCTQSSDIMRQLTRFDQLAETKGFIAVFPEQPQSANYQKCWNFFQDAHMHRGAGEPSLIAGITHSVRQQYTIDPHRTYVAGLSAGGAMASVMATTYPDLYAAAGVGSGCEYGATATCAGYQSTDPAKAGQAARAEMGSAARAMPVIAFQGDKDTTVPPINADQLIRQWQITDDLADDGAANGSVLSAPTKTVEGQVPNGRSYTMRSYSDRQGNELEQYWVVHGMTHAWSGGCPCESYADPGGPDESEAMYAFFTSHPMP
jgi:poly(hydroxyalkanoate) depolymerase family esterase